MVAGLVWGVTLYTDCTHLKANANKNKFENQEVELTPKAYLKELDEAVAKDQKAHGKKTLKNAGRRSPKPKRRNAARRTWTAGSCIET